MTRPRATLIAVACAALLCAPALAQDAPAPAPADSAPAPSPQPPAAGQNIFDRAIAFAQPRCVKIYGAGIGREHGYATGVLVSRDGRIVTAQGIHLVSTRIRVVLPDGTLHFAEVVRRDEPTQLALLKIDAETPNYFELADQPVALAGDWVLAVSNAFKVAAGTEWLSVNLGIVSMRAQLDTKKRAQDFDIDSEIVLVDAITANPGTPGGALVTVDGRLAGVTGKVLESQATNTRLNYAVPADIVARFVRGEPTVEPDDEAVAADAPGTLGIRIFKLAGRRAPAYVDSVKAGSPAAKADLTKDDLVLTINDEWVANVRDYEKATDHIVAGRTYTIAFKRGTQIMRAELIAAPLKEAGE